MEIKTPTEYNRTVKTTKLCTFTGRSDINGPRSKRAI